MLLAPLNPGGLVVPVEPLVPVPVGADTDAGITARRRCIFAATEHGEHEGRENECAII
jgi:hypothetical protein